MYKCFFSNDIKKMTWERESGLKVSFDAFKKITHLQLNHSTSSVFLKSILEKGLIPNTLSGKQIEDNLSTDPDCVYLSASYDVLYPKRAVGKYGGEGIVITVEVEKELLEADIHSVVPGNDLIKNKTKDELLYESLGYLYGSCKYRGIISPHNIISIYTKSGEKITI